MYNEHLLFYYQQPFPRLNEQNSRLTWVIAPTFHGKISRYRAVVYFVHVKV
jgi:hypothetical protein